MISGDADGCVRQAVHVFESHGFASSYSVEISPEYPSDGQWAVPLHCYDRDGEHSQEPSTRWGAPVVVRIDPDSADAWVGMFAAGGIGGITGVHTCPRPSDLCVVADGSAYLVSVEAPGGPATVILDQVKQVVGLPEQGLLVLVCDYKAVALSREGLVWATGRIALDGLWLDRVLPDGLVFTLHTIEGSNDTIMLDVATGHQTAGRVFRDAWPPDALA